MAHVADIPILDEDKARSLLSFGCGQCMRLNYICLDPEQADRLRAMGLCEGRDLDVIHKSDKLIVRAGGCRVGLHRDIASRLLGEEIGAQPESTELPGRRVGLARFFRQIRGQE